MKCRKQEHRRGIIERTHGRLNPQRQSTALDWSAVDDAATPRESTGKVLAKRKLAYYRLLQSAPPALEDEGQDSLHGLLPPGLREDAGLLGAVPPNADDEAGGVGARGGAVDPEGTWLRPWLVQPAELKHTSINAPSTGAWDLPAIPATREELGRCSCKPQHGPLNMCHPEHVPIHMSRNERPSVQPLP